MPDHFIQSEIAGSDSGRLAESEVAAGAESNFRVALACSGIGHVNRGYEASVTEMYGALKSRIDVELYQGNGTAVGERCLTTVGRRSHLYRILPLSLISPYSRYRNENLSFALHFILKLLQTPADIVFTPDHCLALLLKRISRFLPRQPLIVFSNGAPFENAFCQNFDAVHQKSFEHYAASQGSELHGRSWLIANGFDASRLQMPDSFSRSDYLQSLDVRPDTTVVLSLAAHNIAHKRVDWLLSEFSNLDQTRFTLVVAGQPTDDSERLRQMGSDLRCNVRFVTVPQQDVPRLIWASNLMTLCSLSEGFPRAVAEAMGAGRHIFVHPHENAQWILGDNDYSFVNMTQKSSLADALQHAVEHPEQVQASVHRNRQRFLAEFAWARVADSYVTMFTHLYQQKTGQRAGTAAVASPSLVNAPQTTTITTDNSAAA